MAKRETPAKAAGTTKKAAAAKEPKAPKTPNKCLCGCGGETARRFVPGHDARLKSQLIGTALTGNKTEADAAVKRLGEFGWMAHLDSARERFAAKAKRVEAREKAQADAAKAREAAKVAKAEAAKKVKADKAKAAKPEVAAPAA